MDIVSIEWEDEEYKLIKIKFRSLHKQGTYPIYFYVGVSDKDIDELDIIDNYCKKVCPLKTNKRKCEDTNYNRHWICSEIWENDMVKDFFRMNRIERSFPIKKNDKDYFNRMGYQRRPNTNNRN